VTHTMQNGLCHNNAIPDTDGSIQILLAFKDYYVVTEICATIDQWVFWRGSGFLLLYTTNCPILSIEPIMYKIDACLDSILLEFVHNVFFRGE
jgi:hypothetical protein